MRPGFSCIGGFVDTVADGKIGAGEAFAACNINDVRVGRSDGDGADRLRRLRIEDRRPGAAIVIGFPYATVDGADVKDGRLACDAGECVRPPRNGPIMRQRISP
jgi:hypothetical protein